jgi:pimeloyl-ACP methyl ester carboxylesterase
VRCPVLGLFGELDTSTPVRETVANMARGLSKAGCTDFTLKVFPRANHLLLEARTGGKRELPALRRFAPRVFDDMGDWLLQHGRDN